MSAERPAGLRLTIASATCLLLLVLFGSAVAQPAPSFDEVAALFAQHCTLCHSGPGAPLGLRLDSLEGVLAGSDRGPVVLPGDPDGSELVRRLRGESLPRMPLTGPPFLTDAEVERVAAWIAAGAPAGAVPESQGEQGEPGDQGDGADAAPAPPPAGSFASVEPIFLQQCAVCHSPNGALGAPPEGLVLTSYATILAGGDRAVVVPGNPLASELYRRVRGIARPRMPFGRPPLEDAAIQSIAAWIANGAPGPDGTPAPLPAGAELRLHGTLTGRWALDGLPLEVTGATRIDDAPRVGDYVEVRGTLTADGRVRVTRLRAR